MGCTAKNRNAGPARCDAAEVPSAVSTIIMKLLAKRRGPLSDPRRPRARTSGSAWRNGSRAPDRRLLRSVHTIPERLVLPAQTLMGARRQIDTLLSAILPRRDESGCRSWFWSPALSGSA